MFSREENLLSFVDCENECGLEIGPLDKPLVKRHSDRRIFYCDYTSRDELRHKSSSDPNVNIELIPEIDFIAPKINESTFEGMQFDYILASHVIEHVPDMIGWLKHLLNTLSLNGRIILAVPDRRYTFDYFRPLSTVGQLMRHIFVSDRRRRLAKSTMALVRLLRFTLINAGRTWRTQINLSHSIRRTFHFV